MPIISMIGELVGPVFIYLQKPTGRLGPRIQRSIYHANNIYVTCSKSGKLTKSHIQYWAEKVLRPSVADDCLLLLDSWSAQTDPSIYDKIFTGNIKCEKLQIPPKTTGDIQPLDRYFFRQWKYFKQRICDRIAIDRMDIDITSRNSILKMNSLIQNQLTARKFSPMIKYSWHSSGYLQNDPSQFENVQESLQPCNLFQPFFCHRSQTSVKCPFDDRHKKSLLSASLNEKSCTFHNQTNRCTCERCAYYQTIPLEEKKLL
ncbi:unnamed protein product [Rotaria magnacalcarata]|uniref:DDE-1 domain-containing protein n=1 Tax=Rotaria magnacalcarata TaxID=392030 RepID=A0A816BQT7_9BILA|nr:unnamed protein product [Rotaria magnacalcarata]CAF2065225.1 unnamed protein product [Rotaria magnacalcarata]CAF3838130.1 unnamed protein product [Rotaria magnacalcarata]